MSEKTEQQGYCPICLTNVEHIRLIESPILRLLDRLSLGIAELFGIGPWYCLSCGKRRWLFPPYRRGKGNYDPRSRSADFTSELEVESLGNLHLSSVSLVKRTQRARYYSEKFRDGVAEQILSGASTFSHVRQKLGVTDLDLQDWLAKYFQKRIGGQAMPIEDLSGKNERASENPDHANNAG